MAVTPLAAEEVPLLVPDEFDTLPPFVLPAALRQVDFEFPIARILSLAELQDRWDNAMDDPKTEADAWESLAIQYFAHGHFDRVVEAGEQAALAGDPSHMLGRIVALSLEAQQEWALAAQTWERLHQRRPTDPEAGLRMTICLLHLDQPDKALQLARRLAVSFSDNHSVMHLQGALYWLHDHPRMAWRSLVRAGASPDTLLFLAWISMQEGEHEESIGWLRRALHDQPSEEQARILAMPYFQSLRDDPAYDFLLADLNLPVTAIDFEKETTPPQDTAHVTFRTVDADRSELPESLRVSIRLQDYDGDIDDEHPEDAPREATDWLRLRPDEPEEQDAEIIWHHIE